MASRVDRRQFLKAAAALGAATAWADAAPAPSRLTARERRDLFPEGVASGDPHARSVMLWTRRPGSEGSRARLQVEVSTDQAFARVIATTTATVLAASDWTCRVLVGNLAPSSVYWYRFVDEHGNASRIGRTITAPADDDPRSVRFAFVSCQSINLGTLHAYRRMIWEDERAPDDRRLDFVLHLGDFIYEVVWYPEENAGEIFHRPIRDVLRYADGERLSMWGTVHVPTTLEDYRRAYRAHLHDPDLQDARARWPFVCIWDNHEFSAYGWQAFTSWKGVSTPAQSRKVIANQAWFEYQPARVTKASGPSLERFDAPDVRDAPVDRFDADGLGVERNHRVAIESLTGRRALTWGRHLELFITDQYSYRSEYAAMRPEAQVFASDDFPLMFPQEVLEILDGGHAYAGGNAPKTIRVGDTEIPNPQHAKPPQTLLGARQRAWLLRSLRSSRATWKIWGCSLGTLDYRFDPQHLPSGLTRPWPGAGYAGHPNRDHGTAYVERTEIYRSVRDHGIAGFAIVCGDRHSFWAGLAVDTLPPRPFEPVGVAFITGSISSPGHVDTLESTLPDNHPLRDLYIRKGPGAIGREPTVNLLMRHGVRTALEYVRTGDIERARALSNPDLAPHLKFLDLAGCGYSTVHVTGEALECEFVCIPPPIARVMPDGGPLRYRVVHRVPLWKPGEIPTMEQRVVQGDPKLSI